MFDCIVTKNALTFRVLFAWYAYDLINLFSGQLLSDWDRCTVHNIWIRDKKIIFLVVSYFLFNIRLLKGKYMGREEYIFTYTHGKHRNGPHSFVDRTKISIFQFIRTKWYKFEIVSNRKNKQLNAGTKKEQISK